MLHSCYWFKLNNVTNVTDSNDNDNNNVTVTKLINKVTVYIKILWLNTIKGIYSTTYLSVHFVSN